MAPGGFSVGWYDLFFFLQSVQGIKKHVWLVVSTHLKNMSQIGNLPQIGVNMKKKMSCHHLDVVDLPPGAQGFLLQIVNATLKQTNCVFQDGNVVK